MTGMAANRFTITWAPQYDNLTNLLAAAGLVENLDYRYGITDIGGGMQALRLEFVPEPSTALLLLGVTPFLARLMPRLEGYFHYRNLDVSTVKELCRRWSPELLAGFSKESAHTALSDIRDSVAELRYYRQFMGRLGGVA